MDFFVCCKSLINIVAIIYLCKWVNKLKTIFTKKYSRSDVVSSSINWLVEKYLYRQAQKHLANGARQVAEFSFDLVSRRINLFGTYDKKELDAVFEWLKKTSPAIFEGSALDIGANIGNHSLYFSDYFQKVYSFEPNDKVFQILNLNAALVDNIQCFKSGISDTDGSSSFLSPVGFLGCSKITTEEGESDQFIKTVRLDSLAETLKNVKLIKIDIEGHEFNALSGGEKFIKSTKPYILFEQHISDFNDKGSTKVIDLLKGYGYFKFAILSEYPQSNLKHGSWMRNLYLFISRILVGSEMRVILTSDIRPDFYPFIIAIPDS